MGLIWANFARAKLATPPSGTGGLSFTVEAGKGALFPAFSAGDYCYAVLKNATKSVNEVVKIEARSTDAFTIATSGRGLDGTTAQTWTANDYIELCVTRIALLEVFNAAVVALGALTPAANKLPYFISATAAALTDLSSWGRTLIDDGSAGTGRITLGLQEVGSVNQLINGGFNFLRDASVTSHNPAANAVSYLFQRWYNYQNGGITGHMTVSRQSGPAADGALAAVNKGAYPYCVRIQRAAGATLTDSRFKTVLPSSIARLLAGKALTFRFFARKGANFSPTGGNVIAVVATGTGTDQSATLEESGGWTGQASTLGSNTPITTDWVEYSLVTAALPSNCNQLAIGFHFAWTGTAGANDYAEIAGARICASGVSDIPIMDVPGDVDEQRCLEFYETLNDVVVANHQVGCGFLSAASAASVFMPYTRKRIRPAVTVNASAGFSIINSSFADACLTMSVPAASIGLDKARLDVTIAASRTTGQAAVMQANASTARIYIDAEFA